ncbi:DUF4168 domain-containing protein [Rhodopila globiformis]|nr:DUF4168 domain-containing protein [Rhodopila globiformis]
MASFQTGNSGDAQPGSRPDNDMVSRVGVAAGKIALIQQEFTIQAQAETESDAREALAARARADAERAIDEQGISIQDYNAVLTAAETDKDLEQRLLEAAREVI